MKKPARYMRGQNFSHFSRKIIHVGNYSCNEMNDPQQDQITRDTISRECD